MSLVSDIQNLSHAQLLAEYQGPFSGDNLLLMKALTELSGNFVIAASAFGAVPDTGADMRAAIQAALDAAETAGGGVVRLQAGTYLITTVNSPASGDKAAGAYGLEIPSNVTLEGVGPSTVLSIVSGGSFGVGVGISPKGMRTATTNFGASSKVTLRNFTIQAATQEDSNGNLINLVHASDWLIENVVFNGSYYHGLEIDQSRRITLRGCKWQGAYSYVSSGSWVQFDLGSAGPVNRPAGITTTAVEDVTFVDCYFKQRPATDRSPRDIDINHSATQTNRRIKFERCVMEGRGVEFTAIASVDNTAAVIEDLSFTDCTFITADPKAYGFYFANNAAIVRRLEFVGCEFRGPSAMALTAGGSTNISYNATQTQRQSLLVKDCRFLFDKSGMPTSYDIRLLSAIGWIDATVTDNYVRAYNDFGVSVGSSYHYILAAANNFSTKWERNTIIWEGNNTFAVGRTAMYINNIDVDNGGTSLGASIRDNRVYSTAGTGFSYGISHSAGNSSAPARRGLQFTGNFSNAATGAESNAIVTGVTAAGSPSSGGLSLAVRTVTGATTATQQDGVILANSASGSITITLPNVLYRHTFFVVKTSASNNVVVGSVTLTTLNSVAMVFCDGTTNTAVALA